MLERRGRRKGEESQTLPPSFFEGTTTGFILKVSGEAHSCTVMIVMVVTDTQGTELHKPTSCATFSDPHLTVLIPHLTPGPPSGSDLACGVLSYPLLADRPIGFPPKMSAPVDLVTGEDRNMAARS